jgi:effector-binding domain-containing protein
MKKVFIAFLALAILVLSCVYIFIPGQLTIRHHENVKTNANWAFKYVMAVNEWQKWWPADSSDDKTRDGLFLYEGLSFKPDSLFYNALTIAIEKNGNVMNSKLYVLPLVNQKAQLSWECKTNTTYNPVVRWQQYQNALKIKKSMTDILNTYKNWLEIPVNIYGFDVKEGKIKDTMLVATRAIFKTYPSPKQVDSVMQGLRNYIAKNNAAINGYPMLNVINNEKGVYEAQMALPVNRPVPETQAISMKRMFGGNTLVTTIKGGNYTIAKAYEACEWYKNDHSRTSPAIPFQSMITDRVAVPDTAQWVTMIYFPVH